MRKFGLVLSFIASLGLGFWAWSPSHAQNVGPTNQIACNKLASVAVASATTTSLVAGVAGQSVNICGWHATSTISTTSTFQLEYGTQGGPCTTPTTLTAAFNVTSTAPSSDHIEYASMTVPAGAQLCVITTGASVGLALTVYYSQF